MSDERVYRVSMELPVSFDVLASTEAEARNKVRHIAFRPVSHSVLTPVDEVVANYAIGFYELHVAPVREVAPEER